MPNKKGVGSQRHQKHKTLYSKDGRNAVKAPMKMACSIITSNCCSLDTLTLILFKPLGNKCFKSTHFQTLEPVGTVGSLRKGKGKVSSTQKELNNPFIISIYEDRQPLMPTFLTLALYVDRLFFFRSAFPHQMDFCYCRSAEGVRSFRVHQAGTSRAS